MGEESTNDSSNHLSCWNCKHTLGKQPFFRCGNKKSNRYLKSVTKSFSCSLINN